MRILAIAPHPDDVDVGCAGFLIRAHAAGHHVLVLVVTDGATGGDPGERRQEQIEASAKYGGRVAWLGLTDASLVVDRSLVLVDLLQTSLEDADPELILIPHGNDTHQDHRAVAAAVMSAARYEPNILAYETPTSVGFVPNLYVDVTAVIDTKLEAIRAHASQLDKPRGILAAAMSTATFRGWHARTAFAEGYEAVRFTIDGTFGL